jgi:hypothetical protein
MFTLTEEKRTYYHGDWKDNLPADFFSEDGDSDPSDLNRGHLIDYVNAFNDGPTQSSTDYNVILEMEVEVFRTTWSDFLLENSLLSSELREETTVSTVHWHTGKLTEGFDLSEHIVDQLTADGEKGRVHQNDYICMIALAFDEALFDDGRCLTSKLFADTDTDAEIRARDFTHITPTWPKHQVAKFNGHKKEADSLAHWDQRRIWAFSLATSAIADVMEVHLTKKEEAAEKKAEEEAAAKQKAEEEEAERKRLLLQKKMELMKALRKEIEELQPGLNDPAADFTSGDEITTLEEALQPAAGTQTVQDVTGETFEEAKARLEEETEFNQGMVVKHTETKRVGTFLEFSFPCQNKCRVCWKVFDPNTGDQLRVMDVFVHIQEIEATETREFAVKNTDGTWLVGKVADEYLQLKGSRKAECIAKAARKRAIHAKAAGMTEHGKTLHPDAPPNDDQKAETASAAEKPNPNLVEPKAVETPYPVTLTSGSEGDDEHDDPKPPPNSKQAVMAKRAAAARRSQRKRKVTDRFGNKLQVGGEYVDRSDVNPSPTNSSKRARKGTGTPDAVHAVGLI